MNELKRSSESFYKQFETPFLIRHVEGHLIFGPMSRYLPFGIVLLVAAVAQLVMDLLDSHTSLGGQIGTLIGDLFFLAAGIFFLFMTRRRQAIFGWLITKITIGFAAFMLATIGPLVGFTEGKSGTWPILLLGLIWLPGIEFIPRLTPKQKLITIARLVLTAPCVYFGIQSGQWHW